jgi:hypothetical protein
MLKREVVNYKTGTKYNVSFFDDDTVETVRQKIAISADTHPDRLFILVGLKLDPNYYQVDPRRWEALFERLSYTKQTFQNTVYQEYQTKYRIPQSELPFEEQIKEEWMTQENENISPFTEFRIFGVPEKNSFILPREPNELPNVIPSARLPIPENNTLISTLYNPENIVRFEFREFEKDDEPFMLPYYPLLRSNTPNYLSQESVNLILKNSNILNELLSIKTPTPSKITILRSRFYAPLVETNFGFAVRTRFEQIFYGLTVSKKIPYCVLFNSRDQTSLHKFYTEDPKTKNTFIEKSLAKNWWMLTKPARNKPTLIFYRGDAKNDFDRIAVTSTDIVISTYRPEGNTQSLDKLKAECLSWLEEFDSLIPFVTPADVSNERWQLQDMSFVAKYREKFDEFDLLRFDCITNIFGIIDRNKSQFNLLMRHFLSIFAESIGTNTNLKT